MATPAAMPRRTSARRTTLEQHYHASIRNPVITPDTARALRRLFT